MTEPSKGAGLPVLLLSPVLTNRAARSVVQLLSPDAGELLLEDADLRVEALNLMRDLFHRGQPERYRCLVQNGGQGQEGDAIVNLWLAARQAPASNEAVLRRLGGWTLVIMGTRRPRRASSRGTDFLIVDLVSLPPWSVDIAGDAVQGDVVFDWGGRPGAGIPDHVIALIATLRPWRFPSNRVRILLRDWERFLRLNQKLLESHTFAVRYTSRRLDVEGQTARFRVSLPPGFDRRKVRAAAKEDIHLEQPVSGDDTGARRGQSHDPVVGTIKGLQGDWLTVALGDAMTARVERNSRAIPRKGRLAYKAVGELAQVRRLRWGLEALLRGHSKNPRLGQFLFDANEARLPDPKTTTELASDKLLQPHLNPGQLSAVEGALSAPDFFLIQGPPGTGKTTVIAEICYQIALRGGRTMVASQANLAVDHAMSRLVHHPAIRALRRGRAERVEEEGQPFLEDYVIGTWLSKVAADCQDDLESRERRLATLESYAGIRTAADAFERARERYGRDSQKLRAALRQAKLDRDNAEVALVTAASLGNDLERTLCFLDDLRRAAGTGDAAGLEALTPPPIAIEAWAHVWTPAITEALRPLRVLEDAIGTWTGTHPWLESDDVAVRETGEGTLGGRVFLQYVRRAWQAPETASAIQKMADGAMTKVQAMAGLCEAWYELRARAQPLIDRRRARKAAAAKLRARLRGLEADIASHVDLVGELQSLEQGLDRRHREIASWLLRRATAEGPVSDLPQGFQTGAARGIWTGVLAGQRLPSLRGLATRAQAFRRDAEVLDRMRLQLGVAVACLEPEVSPVVLAAVARTPPAWTQTSLADLVEHDAIGLLRPVNGAERDLRLRLQRTLDLAGIADAIQRMPEARIAANVVGLRAMAKDLGDHQARLSEAAIVCAEELHGLVREIGTRLVAKLKAAATAELRRVEVTADALRDEMASVAHDLAEIPADHEEETALLERFARDKELTAQRLRYAIKLGEAGDLVPIQRLHRVAQGSISMPQRVWEEEWRSGLQFLAAARTALVEALDGCETEALWHDLRNHGEAALQASRNEQTVASAKLEAGNAAVAKAEAELGELKATHAKARRTWLEAYSLLPEERRPTTKSATSATTLEEVRALCTSWERERRELVSYLTSYADFIRGWIGRVEAPSVRDEADLRRIYIDNANVIGITCVQAGGRAFSERYRDFDTVVIDEVSKATPPELLLPMLKGAKIVLVGDSRQLPPMVGSDALQDLAESLDVGQKELAHLRRSLFKDLFERAPVLLKSWLTDQYRMHPKIMDAINQFYNEKLACAIPEPDETRAHGLEPLIPGETHVVWIPTPWERPYYETRVGTSRRNDREVDVISAFLHRADDVWGKRHEPPKEIGVITFYAAQERALRERLTTAAGDPRLEHLGLRLGTVDRFQGMERPVIVVSLVCNNERRDIGFARALERINVAFSRAQELLVIVGCRELFCQEAIAMRATERYSRVAEVVDRNGGNLDVSDFLPP